MHGATMKFIEIWLEVFKYERDALVILCQIEINVYVRSFLLVKKNGMELTAILIELREVELKYCNLGVEL